MLTSARGKSSAKVSPAPPPPLAAPTAVGGKAKAKGKASSTAAAKVANGKSTPGGNSQAIPASVSAPVLLHAKGKSSQAEGSLIAAAKAKAAEAEAAGSPSCAAPTATTNSSAASSSSAPSANISAKQKRANRRRSAAWEHAEGGPSTAAAASAPSTAALKPKRERRRTKTIRRPAIMGGHNAEELTKLTGAQVGPTDEGTVSVIASALKANPLFASLEPELLIKIVAVMEKRDLTRGETVIEQGSPGFNFYVILGGEYEAWVLGVDKPVNVYTACGTFGELALMYNSPRAATIVCKEGPGVVWALGGAVFRTLVSDHNHNQKHGLEQALTGFSLFKDLTQQQRSRLVDAMETLDFDEAEYIIEQGEDADALFLILSGEVVCHRSGSDQELIRLAQGEFFGESAIANIATGQKASNGRPSTPIVAAEEEAPQETEAPPASASASLAAAPATAPMPAAAPAPAPAATASPAPAPAATASPAPAPAATASPAPAPPPPSTTTAPPPVSPPTTGAATATAPSTRLANVVAVTNVRVARLLARDFMRILGSLHDAVNINFRRKVLLSVPLLQGMSELEATQVAAAMREERFARGSTILEQGTQGECFHVISSGNVDVVKDGKQVAALGPGHFFGERSLLTSDPVNASIIASSSEGLGDVLLLTLRKSDFESTLGPLQARLEKATRERDRPHQLDSSIKLCNLRTIAQIGEGTFASVKLVEHIVDGSCFALKEMNKAQVMAVPALSTHAPAPTPPPSPAHL
jgi:CRP-like cAMP-binding protein